jgi:hypothetical protein
MFGTVLKHSLATVAVAVGLLAASGSASAGTHQSGVIVYNGHAGLGASVYQHNQTDPEFLALSLQGSGSEGFWLGSNDTLAAGVTDGTSNTILFAERAAAPGGFAVDIGTPRTSQVVHVGVLLEQLPQGSLWMSSTQWTCSGLGSTTGRSRLTTTAS